MRTARRPRAGILAMVLATLALTGCVGIPTSGPIGTGDVVVDEPGQAIQLANDPVPDAEPGEIVQGFLLAGAAGLNDEFAVARKFLSGSVDWDPRARVTVYPRAGGDPVIEDRQDGTVLVTVPVEATVDSMGRYTEVAPGSVENLVFELRLDGAGQWRISGLDDGVLMSAPNFESLFRPTSVYFATQDEQHLVPDLRWFPTENVATSAVEALLQGPSPWLRDAVVSGAPEGARLSTAAVTVSGDRVASVDLSTESRSETADRDLLQAQLAATLQQRLGTAVADVRVTVAGLPWAARSVPDLARDVTPGSGPYVLTEDVPAGAGDRLALVEGGEVVPIDAAPLTGLDAERAAVSLDGELRVVLTGDSRLLLLPLEAAPPVEILAGERLIAPSVDRFGWVWTGEASSAGTLDAVQPGGETVSVPVDWLDGRVVRSLRISRDGARVAVVSAAPAGGDVRVDVAAVVRDPSDGTPQYVRADERLQVGAVLQDASEVAWVDEVTLAVLGLSGTLSEPAVHLVPLGGRTTALALREGARAIAAGRGESALFMVDDEGALISRQSASWVTVVTGVRDVVFPG